MDNIGIVTEETADLPQEIVARCKIAIVPAVLIWPEIEELPGENIFQKMRELEKQGGKSFGKTSQPSPGDFLDKYRQQLERFDNTLCITFTSKLSGSYNSAVLAKQILGPESQERVFIVDSLSGSGGQALIILKAIDLISAGKDIVEIVQELEEFVPRVHLLVMLEDPKWLEASGRISTLVANLMRGMAKIGVRPLLSFKKGVLVPAGLKTRAKEIPEVLFKQLEKETEESRKEGKKIRVVITHGDDPKGAQKLEEIIARELNNTEVTFVNIVNNVIGAPTGPNTIAVAWCEI